MTLMQMLLDAGYPREDIFNHESDLYIYATSLTTKVLTEWLNAKGWKRENARGWMFTSFIDQITGKLMYDVAFAYDDFWEERCKRNEQIQNY